MSCIVTAFTPANITFLAAPAQKSTSQRDCLLVKGTAGHRSRQLELMQAPHRMPSQESGAGGRRAGTAEAPVSTPRPRAPRMRTLEAAMRRMDSRPYTASWREWRSSSISMAAVPFSMPRVEGVGAMRAFFARADSPSSDRLRFVMQLRARGAGARARGQGRGGGGGRRSHPGCGGAGRGRGGGAGGGGLVRRRRGASRLEVLVEGFYFLFLPAPASLPAPQGFVAQGVGPPQDDGTRPPQRASGSVIDRLCT